MKILTMLFALLALPCLALAAMLDTRPVTKAESAGFAAFYQTQFGKPVVAPSLLALRAGRGWELSATVDGAARRGLASLCRLERSAFVHDGRRWESAPTMQLAWIDKRGCNSPARPAVLKQNVPDAELLPMLEQQGVLLLHSRLLMTGNTSCAVMRSYRFQLAAIDVSAAPGASETLYALQYASEQQHQVTVWVKKIRTELNSWTVACEATS